MVDFGLLVGRFNSATPSISTDNTLRELRIDAGGRVYSRLADDRDVAIRYFQDGEAVDGTPANDRGILVLGKNDTDSNYQVLRVADDGSLIVSTQAGTDASQAADATGGTYTSTDSEGEVALTLGNWVLVQSIAIATGKVHIDGWSFGSDKNCIFQLCLANDTGANGVTRSDVTEILDAQITTSSRPSDHVGFNRALTRNGGTNIHVAIFSKQLQSGAAGVGTSMINAHRTT
jgi:hypothetical protein